MSVSLSKGQLTAQLRLNSRAVALRGKLSAEGGLALNLPVWVGSKLHLGVEGEAGQETISARIDAGEEVILLPVDATGKVNDRFAMNGWRFNQAMVNGPELGGFASASANASGVLRFVGRLGDGRPFTASARAVRDPEDGSLVLPVLTRLAKGAGEVWGELLLTEDPADGRHLSGYMMVRRVSGGQTKEFGVHGMRWHPKNKVNVLDPGAVSPLAIKVSVGAQEPVSLDWPSSNRLVNRTTGWQITGNAVTGGFSGRVRNASISGTLSGVLFPEDIDLVELGTAVRGVGLSITKGATERVVVEVP